MSALGSILADPGADRAALREKLEQGNFGYAFAGIASVVLLVCLSMMPAVFGNHYGPWPPSASSARPFVSQGGFSLQLTAQGEIVRNGEWIPDDRLEDLIRATLENAPATAFSVEADREASFFLVRVLLERLSKTGVRRVWLVSDGSPMEVLALPWNAPRGE